MLLNDLLSQRDSPRKHEKFVEILIYNSLQESMEYIRELNKYQILETILRITKWKE